MQEKTFARSHTEHLGHTFRCETFWAVVAFVVINLHSDNKELFFLCNVLLVAFLAK
jgi:hypothetical protein